MWICQDAPETPLPGSVTWQPNEKRLSIFYEYGALSHARFAREGAPLKFLLKVENSSSTLFAYVLIMQLQSIVARSLFRLSGLKCERSSFLIRFRLILCLEDVKIQNCEKWSLTSVMRLPLISTCSGLFTKMLSIKLAEFLWTRVGLSIVGRR